jgi:endonuclease YncB( thermonuclease family)
VSLAAHHAFAGVVCFAITLACSAPSGDAADERRITGKATVVDGDGLEIDGREIRLFGIDAFEVGQYCKRSDGSRWRCGQYGTVHLDLFVRDKEVVCLVKTTDQYERSVAVCKVGDVDVAAEQARKGWALAYRRFSKDYVDEEEAARAAKEGGWAGTFEDPWAWRARSRTR